MELINKLERRLGWLAIGGLPVYVVAAQAILFLWSYLNPGADAYLIMDPVRVVQANEWWRILTFLFLLPAQGPIWALFSLYFQYVCGQALEREWGSFRLTLYYLMGALGCIAAAFIVGRDLSAAFFLNETIFLGFASLYPDFQVLLFFIIPVRVKWIAWFVWARIALTFFAAPGRYKVGILVSLLNYFVFFGPDHVRWVIETYRRIQHRRRYRGYDL